MNSSNTILIVFFAILLFIVIVNTVIQQNKKVQQRKIEAERLEKERLAQERLRFELAEARRLQEKKIVEGMHPNVASANKQFNKFISLKDGYFNNKKLTAWRISVTSLYTSLNKYNIDTLKLEPAILQYIIQLKRQYDAGETIRNNYNKKFIERELRECDALLSNIEGQTLDELQRLAVVKDEDNNLVIAGAGSGKTTTVAGKVAYVIDRFNVEPEETLLITFTKRQARR